MKITCKRAYRGKFAGVPVMAVVLSLALIFGGPAGPAWALNPQAPPSLKEIAVPEPPNLATYVQNKAAAIQLGKALFWDMQVGSDGVQACASCHFHAGADSARTKNQLSPGLNNENFTGIPGNPYYPGGDVSFGNSFFSSLPGNPAFKPNYNVTKDDFPFHQRDPAHSDFQSSTVVNDVNDVWSSQGVKLTKFTGVTKGSAVDAGTPLLDPVFNVEGLASIDPTKNVRRVEPIQAPTVINAVFNFANFNNGRANHVFNGENPFGPADAAAGVWVNNNKKLQKLPLTGGPNGLPPLTFSSLASQAVGPPVSNFEMSFGPELAGDGSVVSPGRTWAELGRKMLSLKPLAKQIVHPQDSALGKLSNAKVGKNGALTGAGLNTTYANLIKSAFKSQYLNSTQVIQFNTAAAAFKKPDKQDPRAYALNSGKAVVKVAATGAANEFTQMEANFAFFFGVAVQLYQASLVSDDSPFDRFQGSPSKGIPADPNALTARQQQGLDIFLNQGRCNQCHGGSLFTNAAVDVIAGAAPIGGAVLEGAIERMAVATGEAFYDTGFYNIGARPTTEDIGRGGAAPFLNPMDPIQDPMGTITGYNPFPLSHTRLAKLKRAGKLPAAYAQFVANLPCNFPCDLDRDAVEGAIKTPTLRNIELTGPYFRDGGFLNLMQVLDFYTRGGNFPVENFDNLDPFIGEIPFLQGNETAQNALVDFLLALTDDRVKYEKAPFDHPQLFVANGHDDTTLADTIMEIPPVGAGGRAAVDPLRPFLAPAGTDSYSFHITP